MNKVVYYNVGGSLDYERDLLKSWGIDDIDLVEVKETDTSKISEHLKDADGAVVIYDRIDENVLSSCPKLKCVSVQSIGYDNLAIEAASRYGVCITNAPGYCEQEVAEHTVGLMLDLVRKISFYDRKVRQGEWNPLKGYKTYNLKDKYFGMVFFGHIPKLVAPVVKALGMKVLVYAPTKSAYEIEAYGCIKVDTLRKLCQRSDVLSLHCPLIDGITYHLIGEKELRLMKKTSFLINTARGEVVDEKALVHALKENWIMGAGVDVIEDEENGRSKLFELKDCTVITPHAGFLSKESVFKAREIALAQQVQCLHERRRPDNLVNKDLVSGQERFNNSK